MTLLLEAAKIMLAVRIVVRVEGRKRLYLNNNYLFLEHWQCSNTVCHQSASPLDKSGPESIIDLGNFCGFDVLHIFPVFLVLRLHERATLALAESRGCKVQGETAGSGCGQPRSGNTALLFVLAPRLWGSAPKHLGRVGGLAKRVSDRYPWGGDGRLRATA